VGRIGVHGHRPRHRSRMGREGTVETGVFGDRSHTLGTDRPLDLLPLGLAGQCGPALELTVAAPARRTRPGRDHRPHRLARPPCRPAPHRAAAVGFRPGRIAARTRAVARVRGPSRAGRQLSGGGHRRLPCDLRGALGQTGHLTGIVGHRQRTRPRGRVRTARPCRRCPFRRRGLQRPPLRRSPRRPRAPGPGSARDLREPVPDGPDPELTARTTAGGERMSARLDVAARGTRSSPTVAFRARLRSAGGRIAAAIILPITVNATLLMSSDSETEAPLHFDSTARDGTKAMVETLRSHGTEVTTTEDKEEARTAAAHSDTTLLIPTGAEALSAGDVNGFESTLRAHGIRLVLVDPGPSITEFTDRITVNDNVSPLGSPDSTSEPDCSLPGPRTAGPVTTGSVEYAETDKGTDGITACYPFAGPGVDELDGAEVAPGSARGQLITDDAGPVPLTVIGNADWVTNEHIDEEGNAS